MSALHKFGPYAKGKLRKALDLTMSDPLPPIVLLAHVNDPTLAQTFYDLAFLCEDGAYRTVRIEKELRYRLPEIRDRIVAAGAKLPLDGSKAVALVKSALQLEPLQWLQTAPQLGWQNRLSAFVLHDEVLGTNAKGDSAKQPKLISPDKLAGSNLAGLGSNGDLASWKRDVAGQARRSSVLALGLSVAFAAPLLSVIDWPTFLVVIHGDGKTGKSTVALAAATVIGFGTESDLPNWNLTGSALPELARCFNDLPLILNGLESTRAKEGELRAFIRSATYILGDGTDTRRHSSWQAGSGGTPGTWRTIALVTTEESFDAIAARAGQSRMGGERARAMDIPAVKDGDKTIIDRFARDAPEPGDERDQWVRKVVEKLRADCAKHYGVAIEPYVEHLIKVGEVKLRSEIEASRSEFLAKLAGKLSTEPINHAAKSFGLIYAGGVQAVRAGLIPLSEERLLGRISACFLRGIQAASKQTSPTERGLEMLNAGLKALPTDANTQASGARFEIEPAATRDHSDGADIYKVHAADVFRPWFKGDEPAMRAALEWLHDNKLLVVKNEHAPKAAGFTIDSVRSVRRLNGVSQGCVVFRDPRPLLKARHIGRLKSRAA